MWWWDISREILWMLSIPSLVFLSGLHEPEVVVLVGIQSKGQTEILNYILYLKPFNWAKKWLVLNWNTGIA